MNRLCCPACCDLRCNGGDKASGRFPRPSQVFAPNAAGLLGLGLILHARRRVLDFPKRKCGRTRTVVGLPQKPQHSGTSRLRPDSRVHRRAEFVLGHRPDESVLRHRSLFFSRQCVIDDFPWVSRLEEPGLVDDSPAKETKKADVVEPLMGLRPRRLTLQRTPRGRVAPYLVIRQILVKTRTNSRPSLSFSLPFSAR